MAMDQLPLFAFVAKNLCDPEVGGDGVLLSLHAHATVLKAYPIADIAIGFHMENPEWFFAFFLLVRLEHRRIAFVSDAHLARAIHRPSARTKKGRGTDPRGKTIQRFCVAPYVSLGGLRPLFHELLEVACIIFHLYLGESLQGLEAAHNSHNSMI
jgi:hypothetical protein